MANNSELYEEMLRRSIFEHDYDNIKEFQQKIIDSDEAAQIWEYMQDFYTDLTEQYQNMEDNGLEW